MRNPPLAQLECAGPTVRVSIATDGTQGGHSSNAPAISADGRIVAFDSIAPNLVANDGNGFGRDIFVHDRETGTTRLVSVNPGGNSGDGDSIDPAISADGRFVAFQSYASDLVPGDGNGSGDVFVRDLLNNTTTRVSVASDGSQADGGSQFAAISDDGQFVAFSSSATNLVPEDGNSKSDVDVFVRDLVNNTTTRVSFNVDGTQSSNHSEVPDISGDGSLVVYRRSQRVYLYDMANGETQQVDITSGGISANGGSPGIPAISADGSYVAFLSAATNLVTPTVTNSKTNILVKDLQTGVFTLESVANDGTEANRSSSSPGISADGRYVTFSSSASNLVAIDTNGINTDIFVRDRITGEISLVSVDSDGNQGSRGSSAPVLSDAGSTVAFVSLDRLVPEKTNTFQGFELDDVFVRDWLAAVLCTAGSFNSDTGAAPCEDAPAGTYVDITGASAPTDCPTGTSSNIIGATSSSTCVTAPAGTYVANPGSSSPTDCLAGTSSTAIGATSSSTCVPAPAGTYVASPGSSSPTDCLAGTYNENTGSDTINDCLPAPAGTYVASPRASLPTDCPTGTYSLNPGAASLSDCLPDADGDTIPDASDNCVDTANTDQEDADNDGVGDACEAPKTPTESITDMKGAIAELVGPKGIRSALNAKLDAGIASLAKGKDNVAVNNLNAFINFCNAQRGKKLSNDDAEELIGAAQDIIGTIEGG